MLTFFKANMASIVSSFCDYLVMVIAVEFFGVDKLVAGITGTICGGIINFIIGRHLVFVASENNLFPQAQRYALVWTGNLLLNTAGMYFFTMLKVNYILAKLATSIFVAVCYNYPLQKKYVFKTS